MRFCLLGLLCVAVALQLAACKTPALAADANSSANKSATSTTTDDVAMRADAAASADSAAVPANRPPSVISVILQVKAQGGNTVWTITNASVKEGHFKHNFANASPGYLKAYFTNDAGTRLDSNYFEDPLNHRMEYPANDNGQLATKMVQDGQGAAYVRANYNAAITTLQLYNAGNKMITSFHLNEYIK